MDDSSSTSATSTEPIWLRPFRHKPLNSDGNHIRLIKIHPSISGFGLNDSLLELHIEHFSLADVGVNNLVRYKALSYTWGTDPAGYHITLNHFHFRIRRNLFDFLNQMRGHEHGYLWIDQLCVDQDSLVERNHQVQLMSEIFSKAEIVYAWLGPASRDSEIAMAVLSRFEELPWDLRTVNWFAKAFWTRRSSAERQAVADLLSRRFWSRVWIVQELFRASHLIFLCGSSYFTLNATFRNKRYSAVEGEHLLPLQDLAFSMTSQSLTAATDALYLLDLIAGPQLRDTTDGRYLLWSDALMSSVYRQCLDPRDHVYGIQACMHGAQQIHVDYGLPVAEVYRMFLAAIPHDAKHAMGCFDIWSMALSKAMGLRDSGFENELSLCKD